MLAVDGGGVMSVGCVHACPVMAGGGRGWFSQALVVICNRSCHLRVVVSLACCCVVSALSSHCHTVLSFPRCRVISTFWLSSLGSHGGSCCPSWMAGIGWV